MHGLGRTGPHELVYLVHDLWNGWDGWAMEIKVPEGIGGTPPEGGGANAVPLMAGKDRHRQGRRWKHERTLLATLDEMVQCLWLHLWVEIDNGGKAGPMVGWGTLHHCFQG